MPDISSSSLSLPSIYKVLDKDTGKVMELSPAEYITGVVAAEMPASFEPEALKAVSYTHLDVYKRQP